MGELRSAVDALAAVDPDTLDPAELGELLVEITAVHDRIAALRARLTAPRTTGPWPGRPKAPTPRRNG